MTELDIQWVRSQFPAFSEPSLQGFAHFENAGGSYTCGQAIDWLQRYYRQTKVQPYHDFGPSRAGGEQMDAARNRLSEWLNIGGDELHFGPSTSQNTYVLSQALRQHLAPGDEVIVTNQDHEANVGAWRRLERHGIVVREWQVDSQTAELDVGQLASLLNERTRAVAFTQCSNIVGSIHPVREWVDLVHEAGAIAIVDGTAYCPHGLPDIAALGADVYVFSLYKVYGPHLGVMYLSRELNAALPSQGHFFNADMATSRFTPAGPDHAQVAAVNGVLDYFEDLDRHHWPAGPAATPVRAERVRGAFHQRERGLLRPLLDYLSHHPSVRLVGKNTTEARAPTVSFTVQGRSSAEISSELGRRNLGVGAGHFYAYRLVDALQIPTDDGWQDADSVHLTEGVVRASFVHYTTGQEISRLIEALDQVI